MAASTEEDSASIASTEDEEASSIMASTEEDEEDSSIIMVSEEEACMPSSTWTSDTEPWQAASSAHDAMAPKREIFFMDRKENDKSGHRKAGLLVTQRKNSSQDLGKHLRSSYHPAHMQRATRGFGLLENILARRRAATADRLIDPALRDGHIVDIGCGLSPLLLRRTRFARKTGIDRQEISLRTANPEEAAIVIHQADVSHPQPLPFPDGTLSVVTLLAVWEHLDAAALRALAADIRRMLKPEGQLILTTPAPWTGGILSALSATGLISSEEISEHVELHGHANIRAILREAGFTGEIRTGYFECFLNQWVAARCSERRHEAAARAS
jgi:SAM-dependent methyltransferase